MKDALSNTIISETKLIKSFMAQLAPRYLPIDFFLLFWLFVIGSVIGLAIEDCFHLVVYREWESRSGLVWGPFSSLYGVGAVVLTVFLNRFYYTHNLIIFLIAMFLGSVLEYGASWVMETFWHAIAWDYTGTFGSINGRTNFIFGVMWGTLGLFWVRIALPIIKKVSSFINNKSKTYKIVSTAMVIFMTVNIALTILVFNREGERAQNIPPATSIDVMLDEWFPNEWCQERFHNMTVSADIGKTDQTKNQP